MAKLLAYPFTIIYFICFGLVLVIFHVLQWIAFNCFGYKSHKISVDWLQFFIMRCLNLLGTRFTFENSFKIPENRPLIIVSNHQSMYDIPPLIWYFRKYHPKFISKKELGKGIPSVSYNLRHGGSVLIDRKDPLQSIQAIEDFAHKVQQNNWAAVIFPEGTRSRTGHPKPFKTKGLLTLFKHIHDGIVVPVSITNSWKLLKYGKFPMGLGAHMKLKTHQPIQVKDVEPLQLIKTVEACISESIDND